MREARRSSKEPVACFTWFRACVGVRDSDSKPSPQALRARISRVRATWLAWCRLCFFVREALAFGAHDPKCSTAKTFCASLHCPQPGILS